MNIIYILKILKLTKKYLRKHICYIFIFSVLTLINQIILLYIPMINSNIIDNIVNQKIDKDIWTSVKVIFTFSIINIIFSYFLGIINVKLSSRITYDINFDVLNHIKRLPIFFFYKNSAAYINQRLNSDSNSISNFVINGLKDIVMNLIMLAFSGYILFNLNPKISLVLLVLIPLYIALYLSFKGKLYRLNYEYRESQNLFFNEINIQLDNIKLVKINVLFQILNRKIQTSFDRLYNTALKSANASIIFSNIGTLISVISNTIIMYFGITEIFEGNLTLGEFTILSLYFTNMMNSIKYFLAYSSEFQNVKTSYDRIVEWLSLDVEYNAESSISQIYKIEIENLNFVYDTDISLYKGFSYSFEKGNVYQLKGLNGSGKSTLVNIIIGLYNNYYDGDVKMDGTSIRNLDMYDIRTNLIGVTEQESLLLQEANLCFIRKK